VVLSILSIILVTAALTLMLLKLAKEQSKAIQITTLGSYLFLIPQTTYSLVNSVSTICMFSSLLCWCCYGLYFFNEIHLAILFLIILPLVSSYFHRVMYIHCCIMNNSTSLQGYLLDAYHSQTYQCILILLHVSSFYLQHQLQCMYVRINFLLVRYDSTLPFTMETIFFNERMP